MININLKTILKTTSLSFTKYGYLRIVVSFFFCVGIFCLPCFFAQALTISPARVEVNGDPGQTLTGEYTLINQEKVAKTFYSSSENFEAQGETGTPYFVAGDEGLASWIDLPSEIVLGPNEIKKLTYSINIPTGIDPGGYFAAIFWGTSNPQESEEGGDVSVGAKLGIVILLRVSGDIKEEGGILDFKTLDEQKLKELKEGGADEQKIKELGADEQRLFTMLPVDFSYRFQNNGGDRIKPKGTITIKNILGMTSDVLDANSNGGNVLPSSVRKFNLSWDKAIESDEKTESPFSFIDAVKYQASHFAFGMYTAHIDLTYGDGDGLKSSAQTRFFVFPYQLLIVIFFGLLVLVLLLKSYNKMIIKKAQKNNNISSSKKPLEKKSDSELEQPKID